MNVRQKRPKSTIGTGYRDASHKMPMLHYIKGQRDVKYVKNGRSPQYQ